MKNQIDVVPVQVSIAYRFALADVLLFLFLLVTRRLKIIPARHQPFVLLHGLCLFSLNFILSIWPAATFQTGLYLWYFPPQSSSTSSIPLSCIVGGRHRDHGSVRAFVGAPFTFDASGDLCRLFALP